MIIDSVVVGSVVGGSVGKCSVFGLLVGRWFVNLIKPWKKTCLGQWFRQCTLMEVYFVILILIFSILMVKKTQIWSPEGVTRIFIITLNKTNREPTATSSNISFIYKKLLQTFRKSICLVKEFFLVNSSVGVFWGILRRLSQQLPRKTLLIFGIFLHYTVNLLLPLSCLLPN